MTDPYAELLAVLKRAMQEAHRLGLYRTAQQLHETRDLARYEMQEVPTPSTGAADFSISWRIGPISEQPSTRRVP